ncbi:Dihydrodipicolinate synthase [halophilic archaeon DL31]|jgi:4-hydroxy-tetrahydrodipicolinate synthase|nr:Dihydrodipicolinate synthase [halophilic archaeon DL31]
MSTPFRGIYPAMTTPFGEYEGIDHEQLAADARRLEAAGVAGLVPVGSTGESATLTHDEHAEVVETVVDAVDIPVVAGAGSNATREALSLAEDAAEAGADALLLISPYYNKPEAAGFREHYRTLADAVDLPQILYNVPSRTGRNIPVDVVADLAQHPNIQGYKAASGDLGRVSEVVERTRDEVFSVLSGDDGLTLPICAAGGTGGISVTANIEPERVSALAEAANAGDFERAREIHFELEPLNCALFAETNPIPVKEAMHIRDGASPIVRSPLTRLSEEPRERLVEVLEELAATPLEA